jgi:hypothetical protein
MDLATAAAVMMGLQVVGKPTMNVAEDFAKRLFGPVADATGKAVASPIIEFIERRAKRAGRIMSQAGEVMNERSVEIQQIPDYLMLPLIQHGSLIDDEDLQTVWSQLIASASSGFHECNVWPSFPQILSELSPLEAKILGHIYQIIIERHEGKPYYVQLNIEPFVTSNGGSHDQAHIIEDNFVRLQLLQPSHPVMRARVIGETVVRYMESRGRAVIRDLELDDNRHKGPKITALGWAFLKACAGPSKR